MEAFLLLQQFRQSFCRKPETRMSRINIFDSNVYNRLEHLLIIKKHSKYNQKTNLKLLHYHRLHKVQ